MCSVALAEEPRLDILADSKELIKICQEYANGGIKVLMALEKLGNNVSEQYEEYLTKMIDKMGDNNQ